MDNNMQVRVAGKAVVRYYSCRVVLTGMCNKCSDVNACTTRVVERVVSLVWDLAAVAPGINFLADFVVSLSSAFMECGINL